MLPMMVPKINYAQHEANLKDNLTPGAHVIITGGLFRDLTGVYQGEVAGTDRVVVLVQGQTHQTQMIINRQLIQPMLAV